MAKYKSKLIPSKIGATSRVSIKLRDTFYTFEYMEEREVKPFTMWRHFKGARSFVITVAQHSETGEKGLYMFDKKEGTVQRFN